VVSFPNAATIAKFKGTLSREIVDLSARITFLGNISLPMAGSALNWIFLTIRT
jgi:hypothetical protein